MNIRYDGRTVIVTGAARGIGGGITKGFAELGARVVAVDRLGGELEALAGTISQDARSHLSIETCDLADATQVARRFGEFAPDIVVHAAGGVCGQAAKPFEEVGENEWRQIYDANVMSIVHLLRTVLPAMKRRGEGRIVIISSGAGLKPSLTGIQSYCSAKHALVGLTRQLAYELGPQGITVNSVAPGFLRTSPDYERQWASYGEERQQAMVEGIAMRRLGEPGDIVDAVLFLASQHASWITGQILPVSGNPFP